MSKKQVQKKHRWIEVDDDFNPEEYLHGDQTKKLKRNQKAKKKRQQKHNNRRLKEQRDYG